MLTVFVGNLEERGIIALQSALTGKAEVAEEEKANKEFAAQEESSNSLKVYDLPLCSDWMRRHKCCSYVFFLPSYVDRPVCSKGCCWRCKKNTDVQPDTEYVNVGFGDRDGTEVGNFEEKVETVTKL